jgi:hypothetical protein
MPSTHATAEEQQQGLYVEKPTETRTLATTAAETTVRTPVTVSAIAGTPARAGSLKKGS